MLKINDIEVIPVGSESLGVRSLCTFIKTPDVSVLLDPSAALSKRHGLEPHPLEYRRLMDILNQIFVWARTADILSISHYHYDHVRPGFTNFCYNFSSLEELQRMFEGKVVFAKDNRERINPSQRRRGHFFENDVKDVVESIQWADAKTFEFGSTTIKYSSPLPHGIEGSRLGYVIATTITHEDTRIMFAPDVQGPVSKLTLNYILSQQPDLVIMGGPPIYLNNFNESLKIIAKRSIVNIATRVPLIAIDHHLLRTTEWVSWLQPVKSALKDGHEIVTLAELADKEIECLEARRRLLYQQYPPNDEFINWTKASDEYKKTHKPPI